MSLTELDKWIIGLVVFIIILVFLSLILGCEKNMLGECKTMVYNSSVLID